jgi:hypothetical protein
MVIGTLVACASYRQPMVAVKMAENLQRLSADDSASGSVQDGISRSSSC